MFAIVRTDRQCNNLIPYIAAIMMVYGVVLYYQYFVRDVKSDNQ